MPKKGKKLKKEQIWYRSFLKILILIRLLAHYQKRKSY